MLRLRFKIKNEFHLINKDLFLQENNSKMEELCLITTSRRNPLYIWFYDYEVVCRFLLKHLLEKPSLSMLRLPIQSRMSKLKFRTRKEFHLINKDLYLLENNWKMEGHYLTIIFKRNPLYI
jgi:hypothetical protein